jgi:hypothetical protein
VDYSETSITEKPAETNDKDRLLSQVERQALNLWNMGISLFEEWSRVQIPPGPPLSF